MYKRFKMELLKRDEFAGRLIFIINKIVESEKFDETFIDDFLTKIGKELCNRYGNLSELSNISEWLSETIQRWTGTPPSTAEAAFVCKFVGIVAHQVQGFHLLQSSNILNELSDILQPYMHKERALEQVYISFLIKLLTHDSGYEWIKSTKQYKVVIKLYFSNSNLYVEREGLNFLNQFLNKAACNNEINETILGEIFLSVKKYNVVDIGNRNFCSESLLLIKLLQSFLKLNIYSANSFFFVQLAKVFDLQAFLNFLLENCDQEIVLEEASVLQVLFFVVQCNSKKELLSLGDVSAVLDTFYFMLKRNQFNGITKLAKYCQVLWSEMREKNQCESKTGVHFILVQLLPALICIKPPDTAVCDLYIQKLFSLTTIKAQKFCYILRDEIRSKVSPKPKALALKGILSVISNTECLNLEEAVIIFQAMAYILKSFIPDNNYQNELFGHFKSQNDTSLCVQDTPLLSAVLNALCVFVRKFKINWPESLESLCLLKLACNLLQNPDLSSVVVVQIFLLVKLAILNFMSPDLALLLNNTKDSSFDCLMPLLHKRLLDPNWEIRDSCLEVITAIAELSESKYPAFQQLLIEKDFYSLVVDTMEADSESYVRASAIQAVTAMTKIEPLNQFFLKMEFPRRVIKLLQNESEGIVRREAALLIKQIYLSLNNLDNDTVSSFYEIMGYLAVSDLHWEVKINALMFWEAVIRRLITDQGMIDGSFPKVTFSKEHKKIVNLTKDEVKLRLDKVLRKLSKIGCLYVLLSTLNEDCDMPVIKKSGQILSDLLTILKRYEVMEPYKDYTVCDNVSTKRKNTDLEDFDKRKSCSSIPRKSSSDVLSEKTSESFNNEGSACSDMIIDEIVNDKDINLLFSVCSQKEKIVNMEKKTLIQEVKLEAFFLQMKDFELQKFLEDKQKWLVNVEIDLLPLLNEKNKTNLGNEMNLMDCY